MTPSNEKYAGSNSAEIDWTDPQLDGHEHAKILEKNACLVVGK
jgi:hypothetical protein